MGAEHIRLRKVTLPTVNGLQRLGKLRCITIASFQKIDSLQSAYHIQKAVTIFKQFITGYIAVPIFNGYHEQNRWLFHWAIHAYVKKHQPGKMLLIKKEKSAITKTVAPATSFLFATALIFATLWYSNSPQRVFLHESLAK